MICKICGEYHPTSIIEGIVFVHSCIGFMKMAEFDHSYYYNDCLDRADIKRKLKNKRC